MQLRADVPKVGKRVEVLVNVIIGGHKILRIEALDDVEAAGDGDADVHKPRQDDHYAIDARGEHM